MSLRDYFAAKAMAGILGSTDENPYFGSAEKPHNPWPWYATEAYRCADAMIEARKTGGEK